MRNKLIGYPVLTFLLLTLLSGCSWFQESPAPEALEVTPPSAAELPPPETLPVNPKPKTDAALELIWKIPEEPVDEYIIRYGQDPLVLKSEHRVKSSEVKSVNDSRHGEVHQYILEDVPESVSIYVSISAVKNGVESPPSKTFKVGQPH